MKKVRYIRNLDQVSQLTDAERTALAKVENKFKFRANDYYLGLINWDDPNDPIRRIIVPHTGELKEFGELDASNEEANYVAPGTQHKYTSTALLLCNEICGGYCRFCFRKRLFMDGNDEASNDLTEGINYIKSHPEINNVLLTGGDPFLLSTRRLESIIRPLREIDHIGVIRIGTKMAAFNPFRITQDDELLEMLSQYSTPNKRIYIMNHFNVPQELTPQAFEALDLLNRAGTVTLNQTPILRGINDSPAVLSKLMNLLNDAGVHPYYFFQCRPTAGNEIYELPIVESYMALIKAKKNVSGLAKRARMVMSHDSGKIEIVGLTDDHIYMKYHRARFSSDDERFMIYHRDDKAFWFDDLVPADDSEYTETA